MDPDIVYSDREYEIPFHAYRTRLPEGKVLREVYKIYKPSIESQILKSEEGRTIFAEAIVEDRKLGTLVELCKEALARHYGMTHKPADDDTQSMRIFYDAIDIESPIEQIYQIEDKKFWRRLVLAKSPDRSLVLLDENSFDWKNHGLSLKYVELVEQCPAEFWPEKEMEDLAELIKEYVTKMHIKQLQPLRDYMFKQYLLRDSDTDKSDSTDVSSSTPEESDAIDDESEEYEGEEEQQIESVVNSESNDSTITFLSPENARKRSDQTDWSTFAARRNEEKQKVLEERKEERRARREAQHLRRERREAKIAQRKEVENQTKPKKIVVKNVFDLPVQEEIDEESKIIDKRNYERLLKQKKLYDYPPKHCHHIDLRFVRLFENLKEFSIIFHPPQLQDKFHSRYFKFSYDDVERLASGISHLQCLRVFRLRESRMDEKKLRIITSVLKNMNIEVIDFGYDYLQDDCDDAIMVLFEKNSGSIKSLELEGNNINGNVLKSLAYALKNYNGHLEYLGLARNPLDNDAVHSLCKMLHYMNQVEYLNFSGIKLSAITLACCVGFELLTRHKILRRLDLIGIPISKKSGEEIMKALENNTTIERLDCRGCGLPFEIEYEIEVCLCRNRYILENPYIGDTDKNEEEIREYCERQKNEILIKAHESMEKKKLCLENRPDIAEAFSDSSFESEPRIRYPSVYSLAPDTYKGKSTITLGNEIFDKDPNEFDLEQIQTHVIIPGSPQRYHYFRSNNKKSNVCLSNALN